MAWSIVGKTEDEKTRLQALALINDVNKYRTKLVTNGVIVNDALDCIQSKMEDLKTVKVKVKGNGSCKISRKILIPYQKQKKENNYQLQTVYF